ncbi:lysophospholipid acyltransferase family protein [Marixanthomonas ophiurae]|uniref:Lipid A biosynthesis acyltransferase n=1 Tax=Marixanthomonas ophiurae TaxID=387659 RepID=A0A3E1Q752_9FLAO|nr:lysophospholipid acyltransferase family protein [Marixanthomonas ophiurae]RFN57953.1 lipid A biosynthesis acyltransferase [Marixanthomonas ophiurae]
MQRLLYYLLYPILWLVSILPMWLLYIKSSALYIITYYIIGYRKKVVKNNLNLVFPDHSPEEINRIAKGFYKHLCDIIFETIKSLTISEKEIRKRFQFENIEMLQQLYEKDKSFLLMCGHYASWEWSFILPSHINHKSYAVYKKLDNPYFDTLVKNIRGRFGAETITNKKIVPLLFRNSKKNINSAALILSDQSPKKNAYKHRDTFMGIDVPVFTGTEELAKRLDFAAVYLKIKKVKRGYYKASFELLAENPKEYPGFEITRMFLTEIENQIKEQPEFYLWSHKRWKHRIQ